MTSVVAPLIVDITLNDVSCCTTYCRHHPVAARTASVWGVVADLILLQLRVPTGSPSRAGDVAVYVFNINQPSLPTPFYSVFVSLSVFMALSTVFNSINSLANSPLSHSVLPALFLPYWSF